MDPSAPDQANDLIDATEKTQNCKSKTFRLVRMLEWLFNQICSIIFLLNTQLESVFAEGRMESDASPLRLKTPAWTMDQLKVAIDSVITQKLRFTQASSKYNIPKGTLYDNILGKTKRMEVLLRSGLNATDENAIVEFCCDHTSTPYNRRTRKSLTQIMDFVYRLDNCNHHAFDSSKKFAFCWWWAFCKKYSIVSLYYDVRSNLKVPTLKWMQNPPYFSKTLCICCTSIVFV